MGSIFLAHIFCNKVTKPDTAFLFCHCMCPLRKSLTIIDPKIVDPVSNFKYRLLILSQTTFTQNKKFTEFHFKTIFIISKIPKKILNTLNNIRRDFNCLARLWIFSWYMPFDLIFLTVLCGAWKISNKRVNIHQLFVNYTLRKSIIIIIIQASEWWKRCKRVTWK